MLTATVNFVAGAVLDPFYADSLKLQEEILSPGGVEIYVSASDLLENVAVIELKSNLWYVIPKFVES